MRALTSRSRRSLQAPSKTAASSTERKRRLVAFMAIPSVLVMACSHRGCLDIHLAGIDDLVLVAGRALARISTDFVDPVTLDYAILDGSDVFYLFVHGLDNTPSYIIFVVTQYT